jgi:hypothetical protein
MDRCRRFRTEPERIPADPHDCARTASQPLRGAIRRGSAVYRRAPATSVPVRQRATRAPARPAAPAARCGGDVMVSRGRGPLFGRETDAEPEHRGIRAVDERDPRSKDPRLPERRRSRSEKKTPPEPCRGPGGVEHNALPPYRPLSSDSGAPLRALPRTVGAPSARRSDERLGDQATQRRTGAGHRPVCDPEMERDVLGHPRVRPANGSRDRATVPRQQPYPQPGRHQYRPGRGCCSDGSDRTVPREHRHEEDERCTEGAIGEERFPGVRQL